jgi:septal ring factor EnvC (AmiA/AmiB activator)
MMSLGLITDFVLVALLAVSLFYALRLLRRLGELQKDRDSFQKLIQDFSTATQHADKSLADLRAGADGVARELGERIERGQSVVGELQRSSDDLKMLIARADNTADKLEGQLHAARQQPAAAAAAPAQRSGESEAKPAQDPQTQALLSALGRIR